jgi:transposase
VARVPRVETPEGKVVLIEVPWARPGSGFTLLFEAWAMLLSAEMPVCEAGRLPGEEDTRLWRLVAPLRGGGAKAAGLEPGAAAAHR